MSVAAATSRSSQLLRASPALAVAAVYGLAQGRGYVAIPMSLAILAIIALRFEVIHSRGGLVSAFGAGLVLGLVAGLVDPSPSLVVPPALKSALCAGLAALVIYCVATRSTQYTNVFSWVLLALSTNVPTLTAPLAVGLGALFMTTLWVAMAESHVWTGQWPVALGGLLAFCVLVVPGTLALSRLAEASVDPIMGALMRLTQEVPHPHGVGLDDEIRLRRISLIADDQTVLFEAARPAPERLRTAVFDRFDGEVWRTSDALAALHPSLRPGGRLATELTFAEELGPAVPTPASTSEVKGVPFEVHGGAVVSTPATLRTKTVQVTYDPSVGLAPESGEGATELPEALAAELRPLAMTIVGTARTPRERAAAIERFFADNFEYTLQTDLSGPGNPLLRLIRERRPAYCVYFASAAAALLRSLGIPARVVGGFVLGDPNPLTGRVPVRAKDAHAWVEVYLADQGRYGSIDPTPWRSRAAQTPPPTRLALLIEGVRSALRIRYLEAGGTPGQAILAVLRSKALIGLLVFAAVYRLARVRRRPRVAGIEVAGKTTDARLLAAHRAYREILERAGRLAPQLHETEREVVARLEALGQTESARAAAAFLAGYEQARFGGGPIPPDGWSAELSELQRHLRPLPR